ncbi:MAG: hypothetical protein H6624_19765 [Bdellovibrionaceae bacterium]|nr:hypothetical protein [Bdellovibrionales bacterium]MCB9086588.1 hypothetical protein [Pseudobdellovibrionaceae bacterium]
MIKTKTKSPVLGLCVALLGVVLLTNNCGDVRLMQKYEKVEPTHLAGKTALCIPEGFDLESFYVYNLNSMVEEGKMTIDSDMDGLSDGVEKALGSDHRDRRSAGKIMDGICMTLTGTVDCSSAALSCDSTQNGLGLTDCDLLALELNQLYAHPQQGLDSDKDSVPDIIEILGKGFANMKDAFDDSDRDLILNHEEYSRGSDVRSYDDNLPRHLQTVLTMQKISSGGSECALGETEWNVNLEQMPLVPTDAVQTPDEVGGESLSHGDGENVILFVYKIRPLTAAAGDFGEVFATTLKASFFPSHRQQGNPMEQLTFKRIGQVEL